MTLESATAFDRADRFVELFHMQDWIWNEERQQLAAALGLAHPWNSHAAYMEARVLAGLGVAR